MQTFFQFLMTMIFGNRWTLFDLRQGYKATLYMNEVEIAMHEERVNAVMKAKQAMADELKALQERPALEDADYIAMLDDADKDSSTALYNKKKEVDGARAEEITTLKNRLSAMDEEVATADHELQKGYAMTYQNRLKYDFIKQYNKTKSYADNK